MRLNSVLGPLWCQRGPKPQKTPEGGFRFPPSGHPLETTRGGGLRSPLPLDSSPDCSDDGQAACDLHSVAGLRARTPGVSWGEPFFGLSKNRPQATSKVHFKGKRDSRNPLYPSFKAHSGNIGSLPLPGQSGTPPFPAHADCEGCPPACPH